jgi:hypothetical protein
MIRFLEGKATNRKWRLVALVCVERVVEDRRVQVEHPGRKHEWMSVIQLVDKFVEGQTDEADLVRMHESCWTEVTSSLTLPSTFPGSYMASQTTLAAAELSRWAVPDFELGAQTSRFYRVKTEAPRERRKAAERRAQCDLFRCVFGHLFSQESAIPEFEIESRVLLWNDRCVVRIAQAIYEERAFDRLPILADALEDAGCDNADLLSHCRSGGEHVRGCWAVDLLLGKS